MFRLRTTTWFEHFQESLMLPLKLSSHIDHGGHHAKHRYNYLLVFLNNPDMSFRLLDLLPSFLPQTIDPDGHYSINGCSTATQKPNGPSRSHQSCGNLQPCSKIPLHDKNVYFFFFFWNKYLPVRISTGCGNRDQACLCWQLKVFASIQKPKLLQICNSPGTQRTTRE